MLTASCTRARCSCSTTRSREDVRLQAEETLLLAKIEEHMDDTAENHDPSVKRSIPLAKIPNFSVSNTATAPCRESLSAMMHRAGTKMIEMCLHVRLELHG
uniref:Uncharacterized protein n=1 Tax=Peronospora matthiolae TaxID=2874970 RepID=A0AAV1U3I8_9STRA